MIDAPILPTPPQTDPFLAGVDQGVKQIDWKHLLTKSLSIGLIAWGIFGIFRATREIFFVYPHLPEVFAASGYDTEVVRELALKVLVLSGESFATAAYGFGMIVKPGHAVKTFHHVMAFLIGLASVAIRLRFAIGPELLNQLIHLK
jgi:hypothetical protein